MESPPPLRAFLTKGSGECSPSHPSSWSRGPSCLSLSCVCASLFLMQRALAAIFHQRGIGTLFSPAWRRPLDPCQAPELPVGFPGLLMPWSRQQIRSRARGNEYQPSNIKRKHKHGWIKRIRSRSGIDVILRRMQKGRISLTH
nr:39S ribosomal protein L34, mitochondrial isoform X2 [Pogona vitticeps]